MFINQVVASKFLFGPQKTNKGAACGPRAACLTCLIYRKWAIYILITLTGDKIPVKY